MLSFVAAGRLAGEETQRRPQARPLAGESFGGVLVGVDEKWNLTFETDEGRRTLPAGDLLSWGRCAELRKGPVVVMADGGLLRADAVTFEGERFAVETPLFSDLPLPRKMVGGVAFELPVDRREADRLLDWAISRPISRPISGAGGNENSAEQKLGDATQDRIRLLNGDEIRGHITNIGEEKIRIEPGGSGTAAMEIDVVRAAAVRFTDEKSGDTALIKDKENPPFYAWAGFSDGSLLAVEDMSLDSGKLRLRVAGNPPGEEEEWAADGGDLVFLQPMGTKAIYLSDMTAAEYRHVPFLELPWPYENDRNAAGGRLRCGGRIFVKGMGVHSSARLTYMLERPFARFTAAGGIDDASGGAGSVRFRVYVDGQKKHDGRIVRGGDAAEPIDVDLSGGKRLDLIVDFGDRADQGDFADWLDARLIYIQP